jgi:hypothetical protein
MLTAMACTSTIFMDDFLLGGKLVRVRLAGCGAENPPDAAAGRRPGADRACLHQKACAATHRINISR